MALENQIRDWLYIEDHVDAAIHSEKGEVGNTYNIGGNRGIEIINLNLRYLFLKKNQKSISAKIKYVKIGQHMTSDILLIVIKQKSFGMGTKKFNLISGLETTIDWYLNEFK